MARHIKLKLDSAGVLEEPKLQKLDGIWHKKVVWEINDSRIKAFRIEGKSVNDYYPFDAQPNRNFGTMESLKLDSFFPEEGEWEYKIIWIAQETTTERILDPKIAVKPNGFAGIIPILIVPVIVALGVRFYRKWRLRNRITN